MAFEPVAIYMDLSSHQCQPGSRKADRDGDVVLDEMRDEPFHSRERLNCLKCLEKSSFHLLNELFRGQRYARRVYKKTSCIKLRQDFGVSTPDNDGTL